MEQTFAIYAHKTGKGEYPPWNAKAGCNEMLSAGFDETTLRLPTYSSGAKVTLRLDPTGQRLLGSYALSGSTIQGEFNLVFEPGFREENALRAAGLRD